MEYFDEYEDLDGLPRIKNMPDMHQVNSRQYRTKAKNKSMNAQYAALVEQRDEIRDYQFTYEASRHEREWILNSLAVLHDLRWFSDIIRLVKGGKEASVYQCVTGTNSPVDGNFLAAKVYRPRKFRNLRKDHAYREGRAELDETGIPIFKEKMIKAIQQRSDYGREIMHKSWLEHEYQTMQILRDAGADIPIPFASGNNAILMEFIGDEWGAAPTLNTVTLEHSEAHRLFERMLFNIELLLANQRVHGDLSAYNILYWEGDIVLIDFPQAISPLENQNAYLIFQRDMLRISQYFIQQGVKIDYAELIPKLWKSFNYRQIPQFSLENLDEESAEDRDYWNTYKS